MQNFTVSLLQTDLFWEQVDANFSMFEEKIWDISDDTDLIVLPEMFTTGFSMNADILSEPPGGKTFKWMKQMATQRKAAITGSYIIKEGSNYYNRLYFVYPDGSSQYYDKKHLFMLAGEDKVYTPGDERLILEYKGWKICTLICYDLRFPVWARLQKEKDVYEYDLLLYVANWPNARINAWDILLKARAVENVSYCIGVNRLGRDGHLKSYSGHSAVYSYSGEELTSSQEKIETMTVTLSLDALQRFRSRFPFQNNADLFQLK